MAPTQPIDFFTTSVGALSTEVELTTQALRNGSIREEEDFTSQMLSAIRIGLNRVRLSGFEWDASVLKKQTEEPHVGADFLGVLRLRLDGYNVDKGFLAQAKMAGPYRRIPAKKLAQQAERMLAVTPSSYVFLYRPIGVSVVPAVSVVASEGDPRQLYEWTLAEFFLEHFMCFVGDRNIGLTPRELAAIAERDLSVRRVLELEARAVESRRVYD